ncbi:hypothetical protein DPQ33_09610 [Oceanidesulfovibrio indonesiensis]|uniref:Uncharacterized protein n=2 Tax=Oceanidesulfovibrio indonesiensis TaxID=54767 RepID=A0A7M3MFK9_9BACT|nr:hypothetical protein DPQ33_09610 [Oceanidesulfovibrio indonesiensis]
MSGATPAQNPSEYSQDCTVLVLYLLFDEDAENIGNAWLLTERLIQPKKDVRGNSGLIFLALLYQCRIISFRHFFLELSDDEADYPAFPFLFCAHHVLMTQRK